MELPQLDVEGDHPGAHWMAVEECLVLLIVLEEPKVKGNLEWQELGHSFPQKFARICNHMLVSDLNILISEHTARIRVSQCIFRAISCIIWASIASSRSSPSCSAAVVVCRLAGVTLVTKRWQRVHR
jgi:hypothetical protein